MAARGIEQFCRLVGDIHACAVDPSSWDSVLADLTRTLDASAATLTTNSGTSRLIHRSNLAAEAAEPYLQYYGQFDFVMQACEAHPPGMVGTGWELVAANRDSEFHNDWQRPFGVTDGAFTRLGTTAEHALIVSAAPRPDAFATADRMEFLRHLIPHIERALDTQDFVASAGLRLSDAGFAGETSRHAVVVIDAAGRISGMNPAGSAVLRARDGLRSRGGAVEAVNTRADAALQAAVSRAVGPDGPRLSSHVVCPRSSGRRPYVVRVVPLDHEADPRQVSATLIVADPELRPKPAAALLRALFGLTPAEVRVALALLDGDPLDAVAAGLVLSPATVKTHLQHIFDKTDTRRRAELTRLLLAVDP